MCLEFTVQQTDEHGVREDYTELIFLVIRVGSLRNDVLDVRLREFIIENSMLYVISEETYYLLIRIIFEFLPACPVMTAYRNRRFIAKSR